MIKIMHLIGCNRVSLNIGIRLRGRMQRALLIVLSLQMLLFICLPARAQANDGLWKTYMDAAAESQKGKRYDEAEKLYKLAESKAKEFGETDERYVKTLAQLVTLYLTQNKKAEATVPYKQMLVSLEKGAGAESRSNAEEVYKLAQTLNNELMYAQAEPLAKYALAIYKRSMKPGDTNVSRYLNSLGSSYLNQGKNKEAEETFKEELAILERDPVLSKQMGFVYTLGYLGLAAGNLRKYDEAEKYQRRALEAVRILRGENHPQTAQILMALFLALDAQENKYADAEKTIKEALRINENIYGEMSPEVELNLYFLATHYASHARYDEAATLLSHSLDILETLPSSRPSRVRDVADRLFSIYLRKLNYAGGEAVCKRAQGIFEKKAQRSAETDLFVSDCLWDVYFKSGNYIAEADTVKKIVESQEKLGAEGESLLASKLVALGSSYLRQKKYDDAIAAFRRAEKIYNKNPAKPSLGLLLSLARFYYFTGDYVESERHFTKLLTLAEKDKDVNVLTMAWYKKGYALLLYAQGKTTQAEEIFKTSVATLRTDKEDGERDVSSSFHELAILFTAQGKYAEAEPLFKQAIELREKALGAEHPELAASLEGYAGLLKKTGRAEEAAPLERRAQAIRAKQPVH